MKHIGRETLRADHEMPARVRLGIEPHTRLQIEEGADGAAVKRLNFRILQLTAKLAFPFGFQHEAVDIAAVEGLRVPDISILTAVRRDACFKSFDENAPRAHPAILAGQIIAAWCHGLGTPDRVCCMTGAFKGSCRDRLFCRSAGSRLVCSSTVLAVIPHTMIHCPMIHGGMVSMIILLVVAVTRVIH